MIDKYLIILYYVNIYIKKKQFLNNNYEGHAPL